MCYTILVYGSLHVTVYLSICTAWRRLVQTSSEVKESTPQSICSHSYLYTRHKYLCETHLCNLLLMYARIPDPCVMLIIFDQQHIVVLYDGPVTTHCIIIHISRVCITHRRAGNILSLAYLMVITCISRPIDCSYEAQGLYADMNISPLCLVAHIYI